MGTPELNQLLEEAAQRCTDVASGAESSAHAASAVAEHATALGNLAVHDADALHQEMAQAIDALHHAREQGTQAVNTAAELLHGLPARVEHAEGEIKALLEAVQADVQHLDEARQHLYQGMQTSSQHVDASFQAVEAQVQALAQRLDSRIQEAEGHLAALQQAVADAQSHVHDEGAKLQSAIAKLAIAGPLATKSMGFATSNALAAIAEQVVGLCNAAIEGHNGLVGAVRHALTDEEPGGGQPAETWLHRAAQPLHDAFTELAQFPGEVTDAVHGPVAAIIEKVDTAATGLGNVGELLQKATPDRH